LRSSSLRWVLVFAVTISSVFARRLFLVALATLYRPFVEQRISFRRGLPACLSRFPSQTAGNNCGKSSSGYP
jgi:hypothetical protein